LNNTKVNLERIKRKQEEFRRNKLNHLIKETKEEFERYIRNLSVGEPCKYMTGISDIINLCNNSLFECEFKGEVYKSLTGAPRRECLREKITRLKKIIEH